MEGGREDGWMEGGRKEGREGACHRREKMDCGIVKYWLPLSESTMQTMYMYVTVPFVGDSDLLRVY